MMVDGACQDRGTGVIGARDGGGWLGGRRAAVDGGSAAELVAHREKVAGVMLS